MSVFSEEGNNPVFLKSANLPSLAIQLSSDNSIVAHAITMGFNTDREYKNRVIQYQLFPHEALEKDTVLEIEGRLKIE